MNAAQVHPRVRNVLHVLPHPGGGGETYVAALSRLDGYHAERTFLAQHSSPWRAAPGLLSNAVRANLKARDFDLVHAHGEVASFFSLPSLSRVPSVVTLHGLHFLRRFHGARYRLAKANLRALSARTNSIICVSRSEYEDAAALLSASARKRLIVIHNGVAIPPSPSAAEREATRAQLDLPAGTTVALFVGKLEDVKEPLVAVRATVEACSRGTEVTLVVVGDGPLRSSVIEEGGDCVRVLGFREDIAKLNAAADLFILPSRREGLSYALLEAMSFGVCPIVSEIPGNVEAVGHAGIVCPS